MLTPRMHQIADEIGNTIINSYNKVYLDRLFSCGVSIEEVIIQVLVLCSRYAYLTNAERHPISYYLAKDGINSEWARKEYERTIKYVKEKNTLLNKHLEETMGESIRVPHMELLRKSNRYPEYSFSPFQYWEGRNIHDMELVKAIIGRRISSSKVVSIERFITISNEYDKIINEIKQTYGKSADDTVFSSLQLFTLQTKYAFDFFYELATKMENKKINEIPDMKNRIIAIAGAYKYPSILPDICPEGASDIDCKIEYPFIIQRRHIMDRIIMDEKGGKIEDILNGYMEANVLSNAIRSHMFIGGVRLPLVFAQETSVEDWASVFEVYDVFRTFVPQKEWTDERIKLVRKMYNLVSIDYKKLKQHSENRP